MKILLVTLDSKFIHANLAVRYLKNFCKDDGFNVEIKEFTINQKQDYILTEIFEAKADIICFSCYIWNIKEIKELAYIIKESNSNIKILCGGPEVSFETEKFMAEEPYIDYVVIGEGEVTFSEFLKEIHKKNPNYKNVKGLSFRKDGLIIINECRDLIRNLDIISYPYEEYDVFEDKIIYYESSRGCPFTCSFCMSSIERSLRIFSMERVKEDLGKLLNTKARQIKFVDRTFNANYIRSMEIMEFIVKNNVNNITIHYEITADIINDEFLEFLKNMPINMFQFEIGVQSLNNDTLSEINRHMDKDKLFYVINKVKEFQNIHMHLDLIAGLPFEDYSSFKESFDGIHKLGTEKIQLGFLKVLKGTKIYEELEKHNIKHRKTAPYEVICTKYLSIEEILKLKKIEELVDKYYNEKFFEKSLNYILNNIFTSPFEFYDDFSLYWQEHDLYKVSHRRKVLYEILFKYIESKNEISDEFISDIKYDFVYNNQYEDLPDYLNRNSEEKFKKLKRILSYDEKFRNNYFSSINKNDKIVNDFRIVELEGNVIMFIYENKKSIFNRCKTYTINQWIGEYELE